jgi:hypothetical protein
MHEKGWGFMNNKNQKQVTVKRDTSNVIDFAKAKSKSIPRRSLMVNKRLSFDEMDETTRKETLDMLKDE